MIYFELYEKYGVDHFLQNKFLESTELEFDPEALSGTGGDTNDDDADKSMSDPLPSSAIVVQHCTELIAKTLVDYKQKKAEEKAPPVDIQMSDCAHRRI